MNKHKEEKKSLCHTKTVIPWYHQFMFSWFISFNFFQFVWIKFQTRSVCDSWLLSLLIYRFSLHIFSFFCLFVEETNSFILQFSLDYILLIAFSWYYLMCSCIPFTIYKLVSRSVSHILIWNFHRSQNCQINA